MAAAMDRFLQTFAALFESGSRYQGEKIVTVAVYLVVSLASLAWAFSGTSGNELGAEYGFERLEPLNSRILFLENKSEDDWTHVRIVLNKNYLHKIERIAAGERAALRAEEFRYFFHVPRPWGQHEWETLEPREKPGAFAEPDLQPEELNVRADQGRIDIDLRPQPEQAAP